MRNRRRAVFAGCRRAVLAVLAVLALSACAQLGIEPPDMFTPDEPAGAGVEGVGYAPMDRRVDDARQRAFVAALADAVARTVEAGERTVSLSDDQGGELRITEAQGVVGPFSVYSHRVEHLGRVVSDMAFVRYRSSSVALSGSELVEADGDALRLYPAWNDLPKSFEGFEIVFVGFQEAGENLECRAALRPVLGLADDKPFDGLVVDARACGLGPSRIVRLLDPSGREVYGPNAVRPDLIVDRGVGSFTTTYDKGLALLKALGSVHPLTVKCARAEDTDLYLTGQGSEAARSADRQGRFFETAKVVFLYEPGQ